MTPDIAFKLLRLDISDMVDGEVAGAHYETWRKHRDALQAIHAVQVQPSRPFGYHAARIVTWHPSMNRDWITRMIDRLCSFRHYCSYGYGICDAWHLASKFN